MNIDWIEVNWICWGLAFVVAALGLSADSLTGWLFDAFRAAAIVAGGLIAAAYNWQGSIFIVTLAISGTFLIDYWRDSTKILFWKV